MAVLILLVTGSSFWAFQYIGLQNFYCILAVFMTPSIIQSLLCLRFNKSPFIIANLIGISAMSLSFLMIGLWGFGFEVFLIAMLIFNLCLFASRKSMPTQINYNLFLRLLNEPNIQQEIYEPNENLQNDDQTIQNFTQFLGQNFLIGDFIKKKKSTTYYIPAATNDPYRAFLNPIVRINGSSRITIDSDGNTAAQISSSDLRTFKKLSKEMEFDKDELEEKTAKYFLQAFKHFQLGEIKEAAILLQIKSDKEVLHKPMHKLKSQKIMYALAIIPSLLFIPLLVILNLNGWGFLSPQFQKPKIISDINAREVISNWVRQVESLPYKQLKTSHLYSALEDLWFPAAKHINQDDRDNIRNKFLELINQNIETEFEPNIININKKSILLYNLIQGSYLASEDFVKLGFTPEILIASSKELYHHPENYNYSLVPQWHKLDNKNSATWELHRYATYLWCLKEFEILDLIDIEEIAKKIATYQDPETGLFPMSKTGTQFDYSFYAFRNTWAALSILNTLNHIHLIDQEKCIQTIMDCYRKGRDFQAGYHNSKQGVVGGEDLFYALQILEMLSALDQVENIDELKIELRWTTRINNKNVEPILLPYNIKHWTWRMKLKEIQNQK